MRPRAHHDKKKKERDVPLPHHDVMLYFSVVRISDLIIYTFLYELFPFYAGKIVSSHAKLNEDNTISPILYNFVVKCK